MSLANHTASVGVQFSGNARLYHYLITSVDWVAISRALEAKQEVRVVTPGKVKDDRLSVSVATVVECSPKVHADAVLPIVGVVNPIGLNYAKFAVLEAERIAAAVAASAGVAA